MEMTDKKMIKPITVMMAFFINAVSHYHRTRGDAKVPALFAISESELYALKAQCHFSRGQRPRRHAPIAPRPVRAGQNSVNPTNIVRQKARRIFSISANTLPETFPFCDVLPAEECTGQKILCGTFPVGVAHG